MGQNRNSVKKKISRAWLDRRGGIWRTRRGWTREHFPAVGVPLVYDESPLEAGASRGLCRPASFRKTCPSGLTTRMVSRSKPHLIYPYWDGGHSAPTAQTPFASGHITRPAPPQIRIPELSDTVSSPLRGFLVRSSDTGSRGYLLHPVDLVLLPAETSGIEETSDFLSFSVPCLRARQQTTERYRIVLCVERPFSIV